MQQADALDAPGDVPANWTLACGPALGQAELAELEFAWRAVRTVKSNAILLAAGRATVGVGMGQVNRVDSARLAVARAAERAPGCTTARTPASISTCRPSGNGKNASEAA